MESESVEGNLIELVSKSFPEEHIEELSAEDCENTGNNKVRKYSFVWHYFRSAENDVGGSLECVICTSSVSNQTSNLARHLFSAHNITKKSHSGEVDNETSAHIVLSRPSRSFIWKYCTKEDCRYARCHLCDKLLYFGSGNTANLTKHLRRKHSEVIQEESSSKEMEDSEDLLTVLSSKQMDSSINSCDDEFCKIKENTSDSKQSRKERKGSSYVWNYCEKLSRHTIRCKLCQKVMSFHGTANVITHLQRRHNIIGRVDNETTTFNDGAEEDNLLPDLKEDSDINVHRRRRPAAGTSIVWKYCTRLGPDVVRCSFCKKNLSFQGTSNLQRHLHRMHGIVTQGRGFKEVNYGSAEIDDSFVWEHCDRIENSKIKCSMCNSTFNEKEFSKIRTHLTVTHAIHLGPPPKLRRRNVVSEDTCESDEYEDENDDENWKVENEYTTIEFNDEKIKKDQTTFDDIIEEDQVGQINCDEDPFDPNMLHAYAVAQPLSPTSSREGSPECKVKRPANTERLRALNEERLRMETEYFREKAGFYRMQKYFTALQAKKVRIELERMHSSSSNGTSYHVDLDISNVETSINTM
uniref:BED-type domain-containing protein n=3 Tax=Ceratitis capitata TaxID=7213 RepID=W8CCS0_CERCA